MKEHANVVRRAKQGASCQLKELMFQNLAGGSLRVPHLCELAHWKFVEHFNIHPLHVQDEWIKKVDDNIQQSTTSLFP